MGRKKKVQVPAVIEQRPVSMLPSDYLELVEQDIFKEIYHIGMSGTNEDNTRLKALTKLFDKLKPDKNRLDVAINSVAPYEKILEAIKGEDYAVEEGEERQDDQ